MIDPDASPDKFERNQPGTDGRSGGEAANEELLRRQKALGDFGDFVLDHDDLEEILNEGCRLVAEALGADLAKVVKIERTNDTALVYAGFGWNEGIVGKERISLSERSSETFAIERGEPVITQDIGQETRFHFPGFLKDHGVVALVNVPIFLPGRKPWGVLQVDAREARQFDRGDIDFLKTYSMVLGPVIDRLQLVVGRHESEAKYRTLFETMGQGYAECEMIWDTDGRAIDYRYIRVNPAFERLTGIPAADAQGRTVREVFPSVEDSWIEVYEPVVREGHPVRFENVAAAFGRWYEVYAYPHGGDRFVAIYEDVTERKRAEAALRESAERQAFLLKLADALRPLSDPVEVQSEAARVLGQHLSAGRAAYAEIEADDACYLVHGDYTDGLPSFAGRYPVESYGTEFFADLRASRTVAVADAECDARISEAERSAFAAGMVRAAVAVPLVKGGRLAAVFFVHSPVPRDWTAEDVALVEETAERTWAAVERSRAEAALRESEQRARLLLAELQHRVRNIMAMIRSVARRTQYSAETVEDYVQHLEGRISAMAHTQALLTRDVNAAVDLKSLILDELLMQAAQPGQYAVTGPDISLPPKAAEVLGLALHELATNAVKYGALSEGGRRLDVRWALLDGEKAPQLSLIWSEFGVRIDGEPTRSGFGTELITQRVPYELQGTGTMEFKTTGLVATLEFPLTAMPSILQTDEGKQALS